MIDFIVSEFKKITVKAIKRYAKVYEVNESEVQLRFRYLEDLNYAICHNYAKKGDVTFNQILDVKIDFKGYGMIAPPFIKKAIEGFSKEFKCAVYDVFVFISLKNDNDINIWLFKQGVAQKKIELQDLFSEVPNE